ncbi:transcriptional repressor TraM [Pararhizobium sp. PWRC1-1]|uniref:transcriptional repressor TraM n=1 Tax=Pararhizobium sp. PWRC1-1 TaxID=2804566 RepID=UPI003CF5CB4C
MTDKNAAGGTSSSKIMLRPVIGLVEGLDPSQLKEITIDAILKHRILRDEACALFLELQKLESAQARPQEVSFAERGYIAAMIAVHAHQTALSTLLDVLGYIPEVPTRQLSN